MAGTRFLVLLFVCVLLSSRASADGKFYISERVPEVPFQRAVIWHDGEREIMVVQSRYDAKSAASLKEVGWVVPLPSVPDVGTMTATAATSMFASLERETRPERIVFIEWIGYGLLWIMIASLPLVLVRWLLHVAAGIAGYSGRYRKLLGSGWGNAGLILFSLLLEYIAIPKLFMSIQSGASGVEIVRETTAGVYEIKVVKSDSPAALVDWLKEHHFRYDAADERIFADYIGRGWCFVTARIAAGQQQNSATLDAQSMVNPLVLRFATKKAVYPLALTATAGQPTEILLYSFAAHKTDTGGRLSPEFATEIGKGSVKVGAYLIEYAYLLEGANLLKDGVELARLLGAEKFPERHLTKFRSRLSAEEMRNDLVLKQAPDDGPYRRRIYSWMQPPRGAEVPVFSTDLRLAVEEGNLATVKSLLDRGSLVDERDSNQETALHATARAGRADVVEFLISRKADVNASASNGATPLAVAAGAGRKTVVELLLENGAEIDLAQNDFTPLAIAILYGHHEVAKLLIDKGANIERAALGEAANTGRHEIANLLIARGANVNSVFPLGGGRFPLSLAAQHDDLQMVQLLVEHGADVNGKDAVGTPLSLARSQQMRNYLVAKGAL